MPKAFSIGDIVLDKHFPNSPWRGIVRGVKGRALKVEVLVMTDGVRTKPDDPYNITWQDKQEMLVDRLYILTENFKEDLKGVLDDKPKV